VHVARAGTYIVAHGSTRRPAVDVMLRAIEQALAFASSGVLRSQACDPRLLVNT
jgi:hypothetical protein